MNNTEIDLQGSERTLNNTEIDLQGSERTASLLKAMKKIIHDNRAGDWLREEADGFGRLMAYYRCAIMEVETKFNVLNEEFSLQHDRNPIETIKTRLKEFSSIREKLQRKGQPLSLDAIENSINDVAGIRVICSFLDDVYLLADALLKQDDIRLLSRKDYIENPKENGYRSLHLIVEVPIFLAKEKRLMKVEIQLRTIAMDFWASLEHQLKYKKDIQDDGQLVHELKLCAQVSAQLDRRMDDIRRRSELLPPSPGNSELIKLADNLRLI